MENVSLVVHIEPVPKGRPRMTRSGHTYTPETTRTFEREFKRQVRTQYSGKPLSDALYIEIDMFFRRPKRPSKSYPKGDLDNYVKAVLDSMNSIVYIDDSQIVEITARKQYVIDSNPGYITCRLSPFIAGDAAE